MNTDMLLKNFAEPSLRSESAAAVLSDRNPTANTAWLCAAPAAQFFVAAYLRELASIRG